MVYFCGQTFIKPEILYIKKLQAMTYRPNCYILAGIVNDMYSQFMQ